MSEFDIRNEELRIDIGEPEFEDDVISVEVSVMISQTLIFPVDVDRVARINGKNGLLTAIKAPAG